MAALQMACGDTLFVKKLQERPQITNLAMEMGQNSNSQTENTQMLVSGERLKRGKQNTWRGSVQDRQAEGGTW